MYWQLAVASFSVIHLASFPGSAQLSVTCSVEKRESLVFFLTWAWLNWKFVELTGFFVCINRLHTMLDVYNSCLDTCGKLTGTLALFAVLWDQRADMPFYIPSFLSWHHSHEKRYQALSKFSKQCKAGRDLGMRLPLLHLFTTVLTFVHFCLLLWATYWLISAAYLFTTVLM